LSEDLARIAVREEQSADRETWHTSENIDFLAISGGGLLEASPADTSAFTTSDRLTPPELDSSTLMQAS